MGELSESKSKKDKRKITVVVTARPSYSRIKTAIRAIHQHPNLELQLVVAASALLDRYGTAVRYMEADGFPIAAKVFNVLEGENLRLRLQLQVRLRLRFFFFYVFTFFVS